jgi:predicted nucleic acid-binding protein
MLDTKVLIDSYDATREFHGQAKVIVDSSIATGHELCVATLSCKDAYFILNRLHGEAAARQCIQDAFFTMELLPVDNRTAYEGFHSPEPDFEDGIIRACAELNQVDFLVTRDADAFKGIRTRKVSPAEMVAFLS